MKRLKGIPFIVASLVLFFSAACSKQWIETDPGVSDDQILQSLEDIQSAAVAQGADSNSLTTFNAIAANRNSVIYYAQNGSMGSVRSVFSVDLPSIDSTIDHTVFDVTDVKIFLVEAIDEELGHRLALLFDYQVKGEENRKTMVFHSKDPGSSDGKERNIDFYNGDTYAFTFKTFYIDEDGVFDPVIQGLLINSEGVQFGKLSVLVGFGG